MREMTAYLSTHSTINDKHYGSICNLCAFLAALWAAVTYAVQDGETRADHKHDTEDSSSGKCKETIVKNIAHMAVEMLSSVNVTQGSSESAVHQALQLIAFVYKLLLWVCQCTNITEQMVHATPPATRVNATKSQASTPSSTHHFAPVRLHLQPFIDPSPLPNHCNGKAGQPQLLPSRPFSFINV